MCRPLFPSVGGVTILHLHLKLVNLDLAAQTGGCTSALLYPSVHPPVIMFLYRSIFVLLYFVSFDRPIIGRLCKSSFALLYFVLL